jgi:hypothetical protein
MKWYVKKIKMHTMLFSTQKKALWQNPEGF